MTVALFRKGYLQEICSYKPSQSTRKKSWIHFTIEKEKSHDKKFEIMQAEKSNTSTCHGMVAEVLQLVDKYSRGGTLVGRFVPAFQHHVVANMEEGVKKVISKLTDRQGRDGKRERERGREGGGEKEGEGERERERSHRSLGNLLVVFTMRIVLPAGNEAFPYSM